MRETIGYNKTKNGIEEFMKLKPDTDIKGKVTVQLINNETKEVEQEIFTENIRMKWLDYQMHLNAVQSVGCVWDLIVKYSGVSTSYGVRFDRGGEFKNILLLSSDEETENEKNASLDCKVVGYCGFDTTYSGTDTKQGSFNLVESNIKTDSDGNLVMHNVYDFPTHASNGTITHVGFGKNFDNKVSTYAPIAFGTDWQATKGLPVALMPRANNASSSCSNSCLEIRKNTFRFILNVDDDGNCLTVFEVNIATGCIFKKTKLLGFENTPISKSCTVRGVNLSNDGSCAYIMGYTYGADTNIKATGKGWCFLTISCETGKIISSVFYGEIKIPSLNYEIYNNTATIYDELGTGNIYMFGAKYNTTNNYILEVNPTDGTVIREVMPYTSSEADNVGYGDFHRGSLKFAPNNELIFRKNSSYSSGIHLVFDKTSLMLKRKYTSTIETLSICMDIVGREGLSIGPCETRDYAKNSYNHISWGIFDRRKTTPMSTLTKLPSPVLKTATFTMKVQYDVIFEIPNLLEAFTEIEG